MERAIEMFLAVTGAIVGISHVLRPADWAEAFNQLHRCGRPGAFANGWLSLAIGGIVVAGHSTWTWPAVVLTVFGWLMVLKGAGCFLAPDQALRSMARGASSPKSFVPAGVLLLLVAGWACYCLQQTSPLG